MYLRDDKCDIDLGREYSILHSTLADLFEQIDLPTRHSLNELEDVLGELTNMKHFYSSTPNGTQIHFHHHHHHIYHHSMPDKYSKQLTDHRSSPFGSQISLSLAGTATTNGSSQGYHSISTSPTVVTSTTENLNKENIRCPLSFTNPIFQNQTTISNKQFIEPDQSDDEQQQQPPPTTNSNHASKALYFLNNLCIESMQTPSSPSQNSLAHSTSRLSLSQQPPPPPEPPLFVLNNSYLTRSTQSLASTSNNIHSTPFTNKTSAATYYYLKTNEDFSRRQSISSSTQQQPPKMGVKALNHTASNKVERILKMSIHFSLID